MLPAITIILFCQLLMTSIGVVMAQKDSEKRTLAILLACIIGAVPAWQTVEVIDRGMGYQDGFPGFLNR